MEPMLMISLKCWLKLCRRNSATCLADRVCLAGWLLARLTVATQLCAVVHGYHLYLETICGWRLFVDGDYLWMETICGWWLFVDGGFVNQASVCGRRPCAILAV
eukprot:6198499-Pleurochrysis_carterae.AAC.2